MFIDFPPIHDTGYGALVSDSAMRDDASVSLVHDLLCLTFCAQTPTSQSLTHTTLPTVSDQSGQVIYGSSAEWDG